MVFENRQEAGKLLATELTRYRDEQPIVVALPRGGVPIGFEIAHVLHAPLDVIVARKIGALYNPEFGIGAIAEGNVQVLDKPTIIFLKTSKKELAKVIREEKEELKRRVALYRNNKPLSLLENRTVILVDDGLATGVTARAAIASIKKRKPKQLIFASPVCAYDTAREFEHLVDDVICVTTPVDFAAVGVWYRDFGQVSDEEVVELLKRSKRRKRSYVGHLRRPMQGKPMAGIVGLPNVGKSTLFSVIRKVQNYSKWKVGGSQKHFCIFKSLLKIVRIMLLSYEKRNTVTPFYGSMYVCTAKI